MTLRFIKSRIILIALFALFSSSNLFIRTNVVRGSPETVVEVVPYTSTADVGQSFTVNITVLNVQDLYGVEATVNWNSSVLELSNVDIRLGHTDADGVLYNTSSTSPPFIAENSTQDGQYVIAATSTGPAPSFNGSGNIVRITFNVTNSGHSNIDLESQLYDYPPPDREPRVSLPIQHTTIGGQFNTTVAEIPNSAILLVFTVLTVSTLVLSKKMTRKRAPTSVLSTKQDLLTK
ncbi:MAG: cohesin domain-containing protein [Candidatus Bathyarchaeia archaeon]